MLSVINSAWIEFDLSVDNCYWATIYLINCSTLSSSIASLSRIHSIIFQSSSSPLGQFIGTIHAKIASSSYFVTDHCTDDRSSKSMLHRVTCYRCSSIQTRLLPISKHQRYQLLAISWWYRRCWLKMSDRLWLLIWYRWWYSWWRCTTHVHWES
jgi:hypothetical protein